MTEPWEDRDLVEDQRLRLAIEAIRFKDMYIKSLEDKLRRAETDLLLIRSQRDYEKDHSSSTYFR